MTSKINKPKVKTVLLGEVLEQAGSLDWTAALYVQSETQLSSETPAQVVKTDRYNSEPLEAVAEGLVKVASIHDVLQVALNARKQVGLPTRQQLVEGLRYYLAKDAFIAFKG